MALDLCWLQAGQCSSSLRSRPVAAALRRNPLTMPSSMQPDMRQQGTHVMNVIGPESHCLPFHSLLQRAFTRARQEAVAPPRVFRDRSVPILRSRFPIKLLKAALCGQMNEDIKELAGKWVPDPEKPGAPNLTKGFRRNTRFVFSYNGNCDVTHYMKLRLLSDPSSPTDATKNNVHLDWSTPQISGAPLRCSINSLTNSAIADWLNSR